MATFTNQATLSYNDVVTNSNITVGEFLESLSATKTAVAADYSAYDDVTYVISIVNTDTNAYTGLTLTDNLGAYGFGTETTLYPLSYSDGSVRYFVNGVLQPSPAVTAGPPMTISGINVPAGGNAIIVYEASVNRFAPLAEGSTINNTATITGAGLATSVTATETITAESTSNLTISKSLSPTTVTENGTLTYTFIIQNTGSAPITIDDNAIITDTFDPILTDITVTFNDTVLTSPAQYAYAVTSGEFATIAGTITVPAATYTQDPVTGAYTITPGVSILTVTGTI